MKPLLFFPPAVALAIAGAWLGNQQRSISSLELESSVLHKAIAERSSGSAADSQSAKPPSTTKTAKEKEPLHWQKIAAQMAETPHSGGMGDMRSHDEIPATLARDEQKRTRRRLG